MLLIIDNYDSFTFNLVQRIGEHDIARNISRDVRVFRNDAVTLQEAIELEPSLLLISPGPCTPKESGVSKDLIAHFAGQIPILGVCLGHQAIAEVFGMHIKRYHYPIHGKTSNIFHDGEGLFEGLPNPFVATRYHSLVVEPESITEQFKMSAWTDDGICMGIREMSTEVPLEGVQFHPESFLTNDGPQILSNFLKANTCI